MSEHRYYKFFAPRFAHASAQLVAVSEATRQDLVRTYSIDPGKIRVAGNAADTHFQPQPAAKQQTTRNQYAAGKPYYLFVGALHPRKNLVNLLLAFDAFKQRTGANTKLLIVGRTAWKAGPMFDVYQQLQFRHDVHLTGRVTEEELVQLYAAAYATVYVPLLEGFGIPIIEAQACASPVLTSDCSSMPEVAGGAALLADPQDAGAITDALVRLHQEPALRASLIEKGLQNVQRYSWQHSAEVLREAVLAAVKE